MEKKQKLSNLEYKFQKLICPHLSFIFLDLFDHHAVTQVIRLKADQNLIFFFTKSVFRVLNLSFLTCNKGLRA